MLAITRKNKIKEIIIEKKSITVSELSNTFNVTEETIRRDLQQLEKEGFLKRIYGGAYIDESVQSDVSVNLRENILVKDKEIIAKECVPFIKDGDSIFLDASTTSFYIATKITKKNITVITNSLKIATKLSNPSNIKLLLIGGLYDRHSMSFLGASVQQDMKRYFVDKAFISCRSVHMKFGITDSNDQQAEIRRIAIEHSNQTFLVVDHTKLDKTSFSIISPLSSVNTMVVNKKLSKEWIALLEESDIELIQPDR
jgi:DeoR/GlpR family transcriptional regulator of sugar metabolism